jgi:hypothetical protein
VKSKTFFSMKLSDFHSPEAARLEYLSVNVKTKACLSRDGFAVQPVDLLHVHLAVPNGFNTSTNHLHHETHSLPNYHPSNHSPPQASSSDTLALRGDGWGHCR